MNSKHQCVEQNNGHVITVLGFGDSLPESIKIMALGLGGSKN
jgi:hypothetical protein